MELKLKIFRTITEAVDIMVDVYVGDDIKQKIIDELEYEECWVPTYTGPFFTKTLNGQTQNLEELAMSLHGLPVRTEKDDWYDKFVTCCIAHSGRTREDFKKEELMAIYYQEGRTPELAAAEELKKYDWCVRNSSRIMLAVNEKGEAFDFTRKETTHDPSSVQEKAQEESRGSDQATG